MMMTNWLKIAKDGTLNKLDRILSLLPLESNTEINVLPLLPKEI